MMRLNKRARYHLACGFTLAEISIAMVVLLIGVLALLQFIIFTVNSNQRSRDIAITTSLAKAKAEELLRSDFGNLVRGGVIPTNTAAHPMGTGNPTTVVGYVDYFDYTGGCLPSGSCGTSPTSPPTNTYFVREWQIWSCDCTGPNSCAQASDCAPTAANDVMKKITVTVTALSPAFTGSFPSTTVIVYKAKIG